MHPLTTPDYKPAIQGTCHYCRLLGALFAFTVLPLWAEDDGPLTRLLDTAIPSAEVLTGEALVKQAGWRLIAEDNISHKFSGDTIFLNDKLAVVLRKQGQGPEIYSKSSARFQFRAALAPTVRASSAGS